VIFGCAGSGRETVNVPTEARGLSSEPTSEKSVKASSHTGIALSTDTRGRQTDLRSPPQVTNWSRVDWERGRHNKYRTFVQSMSLTEVFAAFDARVVDAAEEASDRVGCDLSRGVSKATADALRRAATIAVNGDGHSEAVRLLEEVTGDERVARAKLVGAFGVIALDASLQYDDDGNTERTRRQDGNTTTTTKKKKKRWLLTMFDKFSLPFLGKGTVSLLTHGPIADEDLRFSLLLFAIAELEVQLPRLLSLIHKFASLCAVAAWYRRHPSTPKGRFAPKPLAPPSPPDEKCEEARTSA